MRRSHLFLVSALVLGNVALAACSGDSTPNDGGTDANAPDGKKPDAGGGDVAVDAPPNVTPAGKQLAASDTVQIFGITTDGYVIYADSSTPGLYAADTAGAAAPVKIGAPSTYAVGVAGKMVLVWQSLTANGVGALSVWTFGGTLTVVPNATKAAPNAGFAVSLDGKYMIFASNADTAGAKGDFVASAVDGSDQHGLVTGVDIGSTNNCRPRVGFASNTYAVTSTCTVTPPDGGTASATVTSYAIAPSGGDAGTTWTPATITTGALDFWATDTAGDKLMTAAPGGVSVYPIAGGAAVAIDTADIENDSTNDWTFGYMQKSGSNVIYSTSAGALSVAATTSPTPAAIQTTGAKFIRSISADENYILYTTTFDTMQFGGDLHLTKTTANSTAVTLDPQIDGRALRDDGARRLHGGLVVRRVDPKPRHAARHRRSLRSPRRGRHAEAIRVRRVAEHDGDRHEDRLQRRLRRMLGHGRHG